MRMGASGGLIMSNLIAKIKKQNHETEGYLSICDYRRNVQHMYIGTNTNRAWIFSSKQEAKDRIGQFCRLNPDYEATDFSIKEI